MAIVKVILIALAGGGATFFVSKSKFAKGVARVVRDHLKERERKVIEHALCNLWHHARMVKLRESERTGLLLKKEQRTPLLKMNYEVSLRAARAKVESERIQTRNSWNILEKHGALPIDPLTRQPWANFDDFLHRVDKAEAIYA